MDVLRRFIASLLALTLSVLLSLGSSTAYAQDDTVAPEQSESPSPSSADPSSPASELPSGPPVASTGPRPLPNPIYIDTPFKVVPTEQIPYGRCTPWIPDNPTIQKNPWHLERLRMEETWQIATGEGIKVAVIDTGVAVTGSIHTPLDRFSAYNVLPPQNEREPNAPFDCQHGTIVAGLIGAEPASNETSFSGIAPDAEIIGIRALYGAEPQDVDGVVTAIHSAIDMDVDVINISQASAENRGEYADAIQRALDAGIVVVAAAGNANAMPTEGFAFPAAYPGVIGVGMTDRADVAHENSYAMPGYVSVAAPGAGLMSIGPSAESSGQVYLTVENGTSYAAPIISGVVALMLEHARNHGEDPTPAEIKERLEVTADPPPGPIPDPRLGHGIVNPMRALTGVDPVVTPSADPYMTPSYQQPPAPEPRNMTALYVALIGAGAGVALVLLGLLLHIAIPAARKRGGAPARPDEDTPDE